MVAVGLGCASGDDTTAPATTEPATTTTTAAPPTSPPTSGPTTTAPAFVPVLSGWRSCGGRGQCSDLTVPLDWDDPDGPTTTVAVTRLAATGDRVGTLLVNPGGPGASGVAFAQEADLGPINERFDVIGWDPRGVGGGTRLDCDAGFEALWAVDSSPDTPDEQAQLDRASAAIADDCAATHDAVLEHIATTDTIRDMDAITEALGETEVSYMGFSYGTYLGLRYAEEFGSRIRALVLDGVVDPDQSLEELVAGQLEGFLRTVDAMNEDCGSDCPVDDVRASLDRVAAAVESEPLPTGGGRRPLGPSDVATAAFEASYSPSAWWDFTAALAAAEQGDGGPLATFADRYHQQVNFAAYIGISCVDLATPDTTASFAEMADRLGRIHPLFGPAIANELAPCAVWPAARGTPADVSAPGAPAILVVGNTGDQATPYENSVEIATELGNARLLTLEGQGHLSFFRSSCVADAVAGYLIDLTLPPPDTRC